MNYDDTLTINAGQPVLILARVADAEGVLATADDIESIKVTVTDLKTMQQVGELETPAPATVMVAITTDDSRWTADDTGYNAAYRVDGFATSNRLYEVVIVFNCGDYEVSVVKVIKTL